MLHARSRLSAHRRLSLAVKECVDVWLFHAACSILHLLFPPATQESDRGSGPALARAHSLSPGWIFRGLLIPSAGAIGCLPASLFLAAPANWNLISWAPAFSRFCQLDRRIPPPPPGQDGVDSEDPTGAIRDLCSGSRFGVKLVVLHRVTVLIARGISMLNSVCFPTPWELVTYPLLEVWNSPGEDTYCSSFRIIGTWNRLLLHHKTPSHPRVLSGHPSASRAALSRGVSVWLLCLRLFFFFFEVVYQQICNVGQKFVFRSWGRQKESVKITRKHTLLPTVGVVLTISPDSLYKSRDFKSCCVREKQNKLCEADKADSK